MSVRNVVRLLATAVLVLFWLPWVAVSCAGQNPIEQSGFDVARGIYYVSHDVPVVESQPLLFAVPVAAILVLLLSMLSQPTLRGGFQALAAFIALVASAVSFLNLQEAIRTIRANSGLGSFQFKPALWLTGIGLGSIVILSLFQRDAESTVFSDDPYDDEPYDEYN